MPLTVAKDGYVDIHNPKQKQKRNRKYDLYLLKKPERSLLI